ncbi:MAG: hypothetical protein PHU71_03025 [Candidatus Gracilibacteria bacterium]|nr:hypothetical protein [Candidatus Gracilibacteria bacterium]
MSKKVREMTSKDFIDSLSRPQQRALLAVSMRSKMIQICCVCENDGYRDGPSQLLQFCIENEIDVKRAYCDNHTPSSSYVRKKLESTDTIYLEK